jgi:hypothetical protein
MSWRSSARVGQEQNDMSGPHAAAALRWSATSLILAAAACHGTSDFMAGSRTSVPGTEGRVVVDVRWSIGLNGQLQHRAIWLDPPDESGAGWERIELDEDPTHEGAAWLALCNVYRDRCYALSEQAFDALRTDSHGKLPSDEFVVTYGRKDHLVLPSPDLNRLVVLHADDASRGILELPSLHEVPWPAGVDWGEAGKSRLTADTVAGWPADGSRLALVVSAGGVPGPDHTPQLPSRVLVFDASTGALLHEIPVARFIKELAWSPDGTRLALLAEDYRIGDGPLERVAASMGHGRPYSKLYVEIIDLETEAIAETPIGDWLPEVTAHIVWDPQGVTARTNWEFP